jgi:protein-tyrosine phosphatase
MCIGLPQLQLAELVHADSEALVSSIHRDLQSGMSVYVHCVLGVDRTGFVIGAFQQSVPPWLPHTNPCGQTETG